MAIVCVLAWSPTVLHSIELVILHTISTGVLIYMYVFLRSIRGG